MRNLPNILTLSRMVAIPVLVALLLLPATVAVTWVAALLFAFACITDYLDGYLARRHDLGSAFGRLMDPIADKMLVAAALFMLVATDRLPGLHAVAAILILLREVFISGLREFLAGQGAAGLPVSRLAKWKTAVQMGAIGILILAPALPASWSLVGLVLIWLAACLTLVTGWEYAASGLRQTTGIAPSDRSGR